MPSFSDLSGIQAYFDQLSQAEVSNRVGVQPIEYDAFDGTGDVKKRHYVPTVSGLEGSQYYLDRVTERHCVDTIPWSGVCGSYTPKITTPFELAGHPTNSRDFWQRYRDNIVNVGSDISKDFSEKPWANYANNILWSGNDYYCSGDYDQSGNHHLPSGMFKYGPIQRTDFNTFISKPNTSTIPSFYKFFEVRKGREVYLDSISGVDIVLNATSGNVTVSAPTCFKSGQAAFLGFTFSMTTSSGTYEVPSGIQYSINGSTNVNQQLIFDSGQYFTTEEHEFYMLSGTIDLRPAYEYMFFTRSSGDVDGGSKFKDYTNIFKYDSFDKGLLNGNLTNSVTLGEIADLSGPFRKTGAPTNVWTLNNSGQVEASLSGYFKNFTNEGVGIFPLKGKGLPVGFTQITGTTTSGNVQFMGGVTFNTNIGNCQIGKFDNCVLVDQGYREDDVIRDSGLKLHGGFFTNSSTCLEELSGLFYNDLLNFDFGDFHLTSGFLAGGGPSYVSYAPSGYDFNPSNQRVFNKKIDNGIFSCASSGDFIGLGFRGDWLSTSGQVLDRVSSLDVLIPVYHRRRIKISGIRVDQVSNFPAGAPFSALCANTSGFINPRYFETPWGDWLYNKVNATNYSVTLLDDLPFKFGGMGTQKRVALPLIASHTTVSIESSSVPPHYL
jgi:hypothetical protein